MLTTFLSFSRASTVSFEHHIKHCTVKFQQLRLGTVAARLDEIYNNTVNNFPGRKVDVRLYEGRVGCRRMQMLHSSRFLSRLMAPHSIAIWSRQHYTAKIREDINKDKNSWNCEEGKCRKTTRQHRMKMRFHYCPFRARKR